MMSNLNIFIKKAQFLNRCVFLEIIVEVAFYVLQRIAIQIVNKLKTK